MPKFNTIDDVISFAIDNETQAHQWYLQLAAKMNNPTMRKVFEDFAKEELGHKTRLESMRQDKIPLIAAGEKIPDLAIAENSPDVQPTANMDYQAALLLAMKKEKSAFALYSNLAAAVSEPTIKNALLAMAQEEAKHKLRFELEYDEAVLKEN